MSYRRTLRVDQRLIFDALALRRQGWTQMEIAAELKVSQGTISCILRANGAGGSLVRMKRDLVLRSETKP